jgi:hypothetical protein
MLGPTDNSISPHDRAQAYQILGFRYARTGWSVPASLYLPTVMDTRRLVDLYDRAREEHRRRGRRGALPALTGLKGLTEYRVGVELLSELPALGLTEVRRGRANHAGREVDPSRTIVGTIHTHPWDVSQSIGDVRSLLRTSDLLGGVVTYTGRIFLLVKHPDRDDEQRGPFATELALQRASLQRAPGLLGSLGASGALSAAFDLPVHATRDPYIRSLSAQLGLLYYAGEVGTQTLHRDRRPATSAWRRAGPSGMPRA